MRSAYTRTMLNETDKHSQKDIAAVLAAAGIMPTRQRLAIACIVLSKAQHLSAEQVLDMLVSAGHAVSKATVYNTLGLFARKGVINEVLVDRNRLFYDSNVNPHYHLYNKDTGELTDVDDHDCLAGALPGLPEGTELAGVDVIIRLRRTG